jgi:hypothetical protein
MRNSRVVLIKKYKVMCTKIIVHHGWGHHGFIPTTLGIFCYDQYNQMPISFCFKKLLVHTITTYYKSVHKVQFFIWAIISWRQTRKHNCTVIHVTHSWPPAWTFHWQKSTVTTVKLATTVYETCFYKSVPNRQTKMKNSNIILTYHKINNTIQSKLNSVTQMAHRKWKYLRMKNVSAPALCFHGLFYLNWQTTWHVE